MPTDWLLYVVAAIFCVLGLGCLLLVVIQLPGTWIMLALAGIIEYCDRFYLEDDNRQTFAWWLLGVCVGLAIVGEVLETLASVAGAKRGGATKRGMIGSIVGGIAGALVFTPFIPIPILGSVIGAVIGTFLGAVIGELTNQPDQQSGTMKPATGATIGRILGTTSKLALAIAMWIVLSISAFWW